MSLRHAVPPLLLVLSVGLAATAQAQQRCAQPAAFLTRIRNSVQLVQVTTGIQSAVGTVTRVPVCAGDTIRVGDNSRAVIELPPNNTPIPINQNSELVVTAVTPNAGSIIELLRGALLFISRVPRQMEIRTPFVTAAVEGTEFVVRVDADRTTVTVLEGVVRASNQAGMLRLTAGQEAVAVMGQPPQLQVPVRPRDAVKWALYYEPLRAGDSFEQLAQVAPAAQDARFFARRAALLLDAGQVDEARADLDQAQKLDPGNADALALRAIIAVALNDPAAALDNGRQAVERAPQSSSARLALSYAQQSSFDLEGARRTMEAAVAADPGNAAAWARIAELRLMLDDLGGAADASERAESLAPNLARVQIVRGFTLLARLNLSDAAAAFERARDIEYGNPLAHLGNGLVKIRRGHLSEGRNDLELAVAQSPDDALLRSYLGKAYFDEKREGAAEGQFDLAKTLDPRDPTAFFYGAIQQQTLNRPVEALQDLQQAIELNGNRAVYRSRLLLDQDLAARSASLGRLYRDLGSSSSPWWRGSDRSSARPGRLLGIASSPTSTPRCASRGGPCP